MRVLCAAAWPHAHHAPAVGAASAQPKAWYAHDNSIHRVPVLPLDLTDGTIHGTVSSTGYGCVIHGVPLHSSRATRTARPQPELSRGLGIRARAPHGREDSQCPSTR